ncbi:hypothetical protein AJ85_12780 [Alkalihalobacillus alcalophilus ATCC 27647 = CGMCC 1.3604]|uniref:Uncharacterized protein n=1 Tax=Alkalihalobacillus alcalophilus ATCC 27647 = CGMCC 1.3604 TaxID=1218173 RepID=A0A094YZT2_ALKAL|nr:hypothetical protein [Alkalihalobacillus alcalophilus]KGA99077.1 hypothetical protein BALCAV_0200020 [Alkalihalobacillus alcalophilus ATCC 27647 = CGMCC 1.3604]MED1562533.1 hypothetical protein [Alkalihalobacillus alcalophilus]THG90110.1 hypothetical protein AJ85_12780 [Alkalihalobacillus alcalophilus ATCC 27647 = CGMCC 1.3604]
MEILKKIKEIPTWLRWVFRVVMAYIALLAVILASTIFVVLVTFTFIIIDFFSGSESLKGYAEENLVPISEFMWNLFTLLVPGL